MPSLVPHNIIQSDPSPARVLEETTKASEATQSEGATDQTGTPITDNKHPDRGLVSPDFFFTGRWFIKCFPWGYISQGLFVPDMEQAARVGLSPQDFYDFQPPTTGKNGGPITDAAAHTAVRNRIIARQTVCFRCACSDQGDLIPGGIIIRPGRGCYCYRELGQPSPDVPGATTNDYDAAIKKLGLTEKHGNADWVWKAKGLTFADPHPSDPYKTFTTNSGAEDLYWLEGPDPPSDLVGVGMGPGYELSHLGWVGSGLGGSSSYRKRDSELEDVSVEVQVDETGERECKDCPTIAEEV
ncbi:hypothetical protein TWF481_005360 [Arthrobotrys musiformis]|uniref:Uncharacterized protein n=1 Tax=Arthrobotrys musiformis TaxID=47236 RepID=A0AAV9WF86_9PEZI